MTDEEFAKIEASIDEVEEWWNNLSDEERKKKPRNQKTLGYGKIGRIVTL